MAAKKSDRENAIDAAIASIERAYGKGSIMRYGSADVPKVDVISTGSLNLDLGLGVGGVPLGRVVEIYGAESSGKTTLALQIVAQAQKMGGSAAFIDAEHALDVGYAGKLGVNVEELLISQPDHGEQALEIAEVLVRSNAIKVIVVDSVAALVPKAELEGNMGDSQPGAQARLMSQALRKLTGAIHKSDCVVVFINQTREKIGVMFGSPKTTSGGNALKFYASVRLDIARIGTIKAGEHPIGNQTRVKIVKNKVAPPFRQCEFDIYFGQGVCQASEVLDLGIDAGVVQKSGSWYAVDGERVGQGRENARQYLLERPELLDRLRLDILRHHGLVEEVGEGSPVMADQPPAEA
ncbi:MAG: recombinase RecA [Alphaproteobacteria bacterium]|nr:recombinase RecA [Alphaproteobacteria bacterium]